MLFNGNHNLSSIGIQTKQQSKKMVILKLLMLTSGIHMNIWVMDLDW
jgi:hypothetical protein